MTLIWNWKEVLDSAWSVKMGYFSAGFSSLGQAAPLIPAGLVGLTPETWSAISTILVALGILFAALVPVARVIDQNLNPVAVPVTQND
jgi:hypothetical protein